MVDGKSLGGHPDENLLAAFAEHSLTSREHESVLEHLSNCARCRDVVFLAQQAFLEEAERSEVAPPRPVVMGWGRVWWAAAGVLAVLLIVIPIAVYRHRDQQVASSGRLGAPAIAEPGPAGDSLSLARIAPAKPAAKLAVRRASPAVVEERGEIAGSVADRSGAAVPGAQVTVRAASSGAARTAVTNPQGQFDVAALPSGRYQVQVEAQGFKTLTHELTVQASERASLDAKLDVGEASQSVTVSAANAAVADSLVAGAAGGNAAGGKIEKREAANFPLSGRSAAPASPPPPVAGAAAPAAVGPVASGNGAAPVATFTVKDGVVQRCLGTECAAQILPVGARAVSAAASAQTVMALDSDGNVYLSSDQGEHWKQAAAQWSGRAVGLRIAPPAQTENVTQAKGAFATTHALHGAAVAKRAPTPSVSPVTFELTNEQGKTWVSSDEGKTWTAK